MIVKRHTTAAAPADTGVLSMVLMSTASPVRILDCTSAGNLAQVAALIWDS